MVMLICIIKIIKILWFSSLHWAEEWYWNIICWWGETQLHRHEENLRLTKCWWRDILVVMVRWGLLLCPWCFYCMSIFSHSNPNFPDQNTQAVWGLKLAPGRLIRDKYNSNCGRRPRYKPSHTLSTPEQRGYITRDWDIQAQARLWP